MIAAFAVAVVALQLTADTTGAYLDTAARDLVGRARGRREAADRSIRAYRTLAKERIALGIRALRRDRMLYRRELAVRLMWRRDSVATIDVLGARHAVPAITRRVGVPEDIRRDVTHLAFDPADDRLLLGLDDSSYVRHPLAAGAEAHYRFRSGDTAGIAFPDGRRIRLVELVVIPRRQEFRLMSGSLWLDADSWAVVRVLFRPARPFDFDLDAADPEDVGHDDDIPRFLKPIRAEVRFVTVDYGLWDQRWWLPRLVALEAVASAGSWIETPLRYDRVYSQYEVEGDPSPRAAARPGRVPAEPDSVVEARCRALGPVECRCEGGACLAFDVRVPADTAGLLVHADLPPPFAGAADTVITEGELRDLAGALKRAPQAPWQARFDAPRWVLGRYNRIEGLSLGARAGLDLGRLRLDGEARLGLADLEPGGEFSVGRETGGVRYRLAGYGRLALADPSTRSLGIGGSLGALLLGRDDGEYFRATGVELVVGPPLALPQAYTVRVFVERQRVATKGTDASLPHAINPDHRFRPNLAAQGGEQVGAALAFRAHRALGARGGSLGSEVALEGATGTFDFGRASLTTRVTFPLGDAMIGALEAAAGTSAGRVPSQSHWYLGGPQTLRGYGGAASSGEAFWRARAEVANGFPGARLALFADAGRAGARAALSTGSALVGAGIGASFLDGLVRMDLARALRSPTGWRLDFYVDAIL